MLVLREKGFSLVELLTVVAVIGILATVGIPNYQRYQQKAMDTEAKGILSGIYSGQKIYHAEHGTYTYNLNNILEPGPLKYYYQIGFGCSGGAGEGAGLYKRFSNSFVGQCGCGNSPGNPHCSANATKFTACAADDSRAFGPCLVSYAKFYINEKKELVQRY